MTLLEPPSTDRGPIGPGLPLRLPSPRGPVSEQLLTVEGMFAAHLLDAWGRAESSLLPLGMPHG